MVKIVINRNVTLGSVREEFRWLKVSDLFSSNQECPWKHFYVTIMVTVNHQPAVLKFKSWQVGTLKLSPNCFFTGLLLMMVQSASLCTRVIKLWVIKLSVLMKMTLLHENRGTFLLCFPNIKPMASPDWVFSSRYKPLVDHRQVMQIRTLTFLLCTQLSQSSEELIFTVGSWFPCSLSAGFPAVWKKRITRLSPSAMYLGDLGGRS